MRHMSCYTFIMQENVFAHGQSRTTIILRRIFSRLPNNTLMSEYAIGMLAELISKLSLALLDVKGRPKNVLGR